MLHAFIHIGGPVIALLGVLVGVAGTLMMSHQYHPFTSFKLLTHSFNIAARLLIKSPEDTRRLMYETSQLSLVNEEDRGRSLFGLYCLIFSFFLQMFGAVLMLIDMLLPQAH